MPFPTDRGYVLIRENADGSKRVEIHVKRPDGRESTPSAVHYHVESLVVQTESGFVVRGDRQLSREPLEVTWDDEDRELHIRDLSLPAL